MKKRNLKLVFVLLSISAASIFFFPSIFNCGKNNFIKIGLILPLTGYGINSGNEVLNGIKYASDELNKWGGINNKRIKLIVRDCMSDPDKAALLFNEVESKEKPLFYMTCLSSIALKLSEEAEKNKAVLFCLITSASDITKDKNYVFRYWPKPEKHINAFIKILEKIKIKNIGLLYVNEAFGNSINNAMNEKNNNNEYKIKNIIYELNETNYDAAVKKILDKEAVIIAGQEANMSPIINSLISNNYKGHAICNSAVITYYSKDEYALDNLYAALPLIYDQNYQFSKKVKESFEKNLNKNFGYYTAIGYDMSSMIFDLIKDKDIDREKLIKIFDNGFVHTGVFGTVVVNKGMHDFSFELYPVKIESGKFIYDW